MSSSKEQDVNPISRGEGRCNRFLEWLEINVTRWNRHKPVYYLPEKYLLAFFGIVFSLAVLGLICMFFYDEKIAIYVFFYPALLIEVIFIPAFVILILFRRVRISPYKPKETPLPV